MLLIFNSIAYKSEFESADSTMLCCYAVEILIHLFGIFVAFRFLRTTLWFHCHYYKPAFSTLSRVFVCFSISICLAFTSLHPDFNLYTVRFYFFQCVVNITCFVCYFIHMAYYWAFLQSDSSLAPTLMHCLFIDWVCFNYFTILNPHSSKCTPIPMACNNFIAFYFFICLTV